MWTFKVRIYPTINLPFPFVATYAKYVEGNGNLLQRPRLENPRDGGAWWAAVYGFAQSQTRLKRLSSSSSSMLNMEKAMAPHSSILAWKIPWMEEPGGLQSMGWLRVGHDWATSLSLFTFMHWRRKWQPTLVFLPGKFQRRGSLAGCRLWVAQGRTRLKWLSSSSMLNIGLCMLHYYKSSHSYLYLRGCIWSTLNYLYRLFITNYLLFQLYWHTTDL